MRKPKPHQFVVTVQSIYQGRKRDTQAHIKQAVMQWGGQYGTPYHLLPEHITVTVKPYKGDLK